MARRFLRITGALSLAYLASVPKAAHAFGDVGTFEARPLLVGDQTSSRRLPALALWATELTNRTSAPARAKPREVRAGDDALFDVPFAYWSDNRQLQPLSRTEVANMRRFFALGGMLLVDDAAPGESGPGAFGDYARRELARVLPDMAPNPLSADHVLYKAFYLVQRPEGRANHTRPLEVLSRSGKVKVIFSSHDIAGALSKAPNGGWESHLTGGEPQRERVVRLLVNISMYVLCSNYKDDQVHAPFLMRRRGLAPVP
jgi:hypothetical protein